MSYYDHKEWLMHQHKENKRKMEEKQEAWAKEQKNIILGEIKQLKGTQIALSKIYTKKEIASIKKAELKEMKDLLNAERKEVLSDEKKQFENDIKFLKKQMTERKNEYNKTKKRLSKIDKETLDFMTVELKERWKKQWGGTRKNNR